MTSIHIIAAFMGGVLVGFMICSAMRSWLIAELREDCHEWRMASKEDRRAHARCADALTTVQGKITDIRDLVDARRPIRKADIRAVLGDA